MPRRARSHSGKKRDAPRARLDVDERREQLLGLARSLFSHRSYDEVSIDELAQLAGVSKGLLYHYFPTKRDLYVAGLRQAAKQLLDETDTAGGDGADEERARRRLDAYLDFVQRHERAFVALMRGGIGFDPEVSSIIDEVRETFVARILKDIPRGLLGPLVRTTLRGCIGFVEAMTIDWVLHRRVRREQLVTLLQGVIFDAVARAGTLQQR